MFIMQKATDVTTDRLTATYLFPASDRPVIRGNMVASIDGAATANGKSGGLASDGDHQIFHLQRALAEALDCELLTADRRLARAAGPRCAIRVL